MNEKALEVLEFPKVRERLAHYTAFAASRELALALLPQVDGQVVATALDETSEARHLLATQPTFGVRGARDVRAVAESARLGKVLDPAQLLDVLTTLQSAGRVQRSLSRVRELTPRLARRAATIEPCSPLQQAIRASIAENGDILDSASPPLAHIRSQLRTAHSRLMEAFNRLVTGPRRELLQEPIVTMRAGRYVVPVKQEHRTTFRGIIHDQSASGATVFMEPLDLIDQNNQWRQLQIEEQREIERILAQLSHMVGECHDEIVGAVAVLAALDLALAKARYAREVRAVCPRLTDDYRLDLVAARHPLLTGHVVPIAVSLGPATSTYWVLVITGPNTGGKTVALKTIGLLCLMAQAGLHIPAEDGSTVPVWHDVFADIGDEQSIEQSLSTFSSHMGNIVHILNAATSRCLVLLDEIGVGTDPQEGSALARAILSNLVARRICTVATTHYSALKAYAATTPGVQNASVEFDADSLVPIYRLQIGLPGRSYALAIAARLGLPDEVLTEAQGLLAPEAAQVEELLAMIQAERRAASEALADATREREQATRQRVEFEERLAQIDDERDRLLAAARDEAQAILDEARRTLRRVQQHVPALTPAARAVAQASAHEIAAAQRRLAPLSGRGRRAAMDMAAPLGVGDRVRIRRLNTVGQVIAPPTDRGEVAVQLGTLRTRVPVTDLIPVSKREARRATDHVGREQPSSPGEPAVRLPPVPVVAMEYDVRGQRVEQALSEVERYLDDASRSTMPFVRIIHGKGTGALRKAIRDRLADHPLVASFEEADAQSGGDGATVVRLVR